MPDSPVTPKRPGGATTLNASVPTTSALIPLMGNNRALLHKGYVGPALATVVLIAVLFTSQGDPQRYIQALGAYIGLAGFYAIYRLCGKSRAWYASAGVALASAFIVGTPLFGLYDLLFRHVLPGNVGAVPDDASFAQRFVPYFFGAGLCEEAVKATPLLILLFYTNRLKSPVRERAGIVEPLDGIVLGAAAGLGFTMLETLFEYVPRTIAEITAKSGSEGTGYLLGLELAIPRIVGSVFGHMGYAGVFGYSIGLAALYPKARWRILPIGYVTAALLHTLWDTAARGGVMMVLVKVLVYVALLAAILKGRQLSPFRGQNFATELASGSLLARLAPATTAPATAGVAVPPAAPAPAAYVPAPYAPAATAAAPFAPAQPAPHAAPHAAPNGVVSNGAAAAPFTLRVGGGGAAVRLDAGALLYERDVPGLRAARPDGVVAEVGRNPKDPDVLGLTNRSQQPWTVEAAPGAAPGRVIAAGQTVRLAPGLQLALGGSRAVVA